QTSCDSPDVAWHNAEVTLACHYTDGGSGPATQDVSLSTNVGDGFENANAAASANGAKACDAVINCATSPANILGNKVVRMAPQQTSCDSPDVACHNAEVTLASPSTDGAAVP